MKSYDDCICLTIPAKAEYVDIARLTLYGAATQMGFAYEEIEDMKVAVSEACNNAVLHAYDGREAGIISITFQMEREMIRVIVKDQGIRTDSDCLVKKSPTLHDRRLDELQEGGLGVYLMQALMDQVDIRYDGGTEVVLTKRLKSVTAI